MSRSLGRGSRLLGLLFVALLAGCAPAQDRGPRSGLERAVGFDQESWDALLRKHEDDLVDCMRSRGFMFWSEADWSYLTLGPHGLFGLATPSAELEYLDTYGYGVTQRVHVLRAQLREVNHLSNEQYATSLSPVRRRAYIRALYGDGSQAGCAQPIDDAVARLGLPDGGAVGDQFARAVRASHHSTGYKKWESTTIRCLEDRGISVPAHRLANVERPFLLRLLRLAHSKHSVDEDGNVHYDLSVEEVSRIDSADLSTLHVDEMRSARVEVTCRRRAGDGAQNALDRESSEIATRNRWEVAQLRRALAQFRR